MARREERALNIGSASPLRNFGNPNDLKDIDVYERHSLTFLKEAEGLPMHATSDVPDQSITLSTPALTSGATAETAKTQSARSSKRS
jgi:hypothetical protein